MKFLLLLAVMFLSSQLFPQRIIVFSKIEKCYLDLTNTPCKPEGAENIAFANYFINQANKDNLNLVKEKLITPPLEWGKKVSDSTYGEINYYNSFKHGFITDLQLHNLLPDHNYLLTLNGNPKLAGNDLLPDTVPNLPIEKYYDFLSVRTDARGEYRARIAVYLKKGDYHVRFYVKDTEGFKIVLYHDYFKFAVL